MTLAILELGLAGILAWCAIKCTKLTGALVGKEEPGTHCSGSLVALAIGILGYGLSAFLQKLLLLGGIGAAARALGGKGAGGGSGSGGGESPGGGGTAPVAPTEPTPTPTPELPAPSVPEIPFAVSDTGPNQSSGNTATVVGGDYTVQVTPASAVQQQQVAFTGFA